MAQDSGIQRDFVSPFESVVGGDIIHAKKARNAANNGRLNLDSIRSRMASAKEDKLASLRDELNHAESEFDHFVLVAKSAMNTVLESVFITLQSFYRLFRSLDCSMYDTY